MTRPRWHVEGRKTSPTTFEVEAIRETVYAHSECEGKNLDLLLEDLESCHQNPMSSQGDVGSL